MKTPWTKKLIVNNIPKKAVEPYTAQLINELQNQQYPVLGITRKHVSTAYADNFDQITYQHLLSLGIDLKKTLNYLSIFAQTAEIAYSFDYGMIFTHKQPEGPILISFIKRLPFQLEKVVMIDNSYESLANVATSLDSIEVDFIGLRYNRSDEIYQTFDPDLGIIQFFEFLKGNPNVSDEEARQFKAEHLDLNYEALLKNFIISFKGLGS